MIGINTCNGSMMAKIFHTSNSTRKSQEARATGLVVGREVFTLYLSEGRTIDVPFACFPRLAVATSKQRAHFEVCAGGRMLHWPEIDEDIEVQHMLKGMTPVKTEPLQASAVAELRTNYKVVGRKD
jgi:hypothetical protein